MKATKKNREMFNKMGKYLTTKLIKKLYGLYKTFWVEYKQFFSI